MTTTFGLRLRQAVRKEDVSFAEFARRIGIDPADLDRYLSGKRSPGVAILSRILTALPEVDARQLITGEIA